MGGAGGKLGNPRRCTTGGPLIGVVLELKFASPADKTVKDDQPTITTARRSGGQVPDTGTGCTGPGYTVLRHSTTLLRPQFYAPSAVVTPVHRPGSSLVHMPRHAAQHT